MRVLIIKGRRPQTHQFSNKGRVRNPTWQHVDLSVGPPNDLVFGLNTVNEPTAGLLGNFALQTLAAAGLGLNSLHQSNPNFLATWQSQQHGWRVFMKMKDWRENQLVHGPGLLDVNGYQTGVFTMLSPALKLPGQEPEPFLLMVDNQNAVRLVTAKSVLAGVPILMDRQQHGRPYRLDRVVEAANGDDNYDQGGPARTNAPGWIRARLWPQNRNMWTQESVFIQGEYRKMCTALQTCWTDIQTVEWGTNGYAMSNAQGVARGVYEAALVQMVTPPDFTYEFTVDTAAIQTLVDRWVASIDVFEAAVQDHMLTQATRDFVLTLRNWFGQTAAGGNISLLMGDFRAPNPTVLSPIRLAYSDAWDANPMVIRDATHGRDLSVIANATANWPLSASTAEVYMPPLVALNWEYDQYESLIDITAPRASALVVPSLKYRIWGLCDCWGPRDLTPKDVLRDLPLPESKHWSMNEHYVPATRPGRIPACTEWVDSWAQVDPVLRTGPGGAWAQVDPGRNYRGAPPTGPVAHPLGVTRANGGGGWVATQDMGGAADA